MKTIDITNINQLLSHLATLPKEKVLAFVIDCAKRALVVWEKEHPNDDRPRKAVEAAQAVLKNDTETNREAAKVAADAAANAADAANAAYYAAYSAASASWAASWAAAKAAYYAVDAAYWTAYVAEDKEREYSFQRRFLFPNGIDIMYEKALEVANKQFD